jgi:acetamidase/formamidase
LRAGTSLFLPVWVEGARFSVGDGHGRQGDGEVCVNALETGLTGTFRFILHKAAHERRPFAETPDHWIVMGLDEDLDLAMRQAIREAIALICRKTGLTRGYAYQLCSLAVDFRVTQVVNGVKGVHGMIERAMLDGCQIAIKK